MTSIILHFTLIIIILISSLILMICIMLVLTYDFFHLDLIGEILENWNKNLVKNFIIKKSENVNFSDNLELILNYKFPGIIQGCIYSNNLMNSYLRGKCSCKGNEEECTNVNKIEGRILRHFYFNNNNYSIYIERFDNENYLNYILNEKECIFQFCDFDYKDCGIIDSLGNHLCLKQKEKCPFMKRINNNIKTQFNFINEIKESLLLEIKYSINDICIKEEESPLFTNINFPFYDNEFSDNIISENCVTSLLNNITIDNRYNKLMEINISHIFPEDLKKDLNEISNFEFDKLLKENLKFFFRKFIGFKKECRIYLNYLKSFNSIKEKLRFSFTLFLIIDLIVVPYFLLFILIVTQIEYYNLHLHLVLYIFYAVFLLFYLIMFFVEYFQMKISYEQSIEISDKFCGDNITNNILYMVRADSNILIKYIFYCIFVIIIILISTLLKGFLVFLKIKKKQVISSLINGLESNNHNNFLTRFEMEIFFS